MFDSKEFKIKPVVIKLFFLLGLVSLVLVGVDKVYRAKYKLDYEWPKHLWYEPVIDEPYEIVKVGNSHAQDGISFKGYKLKSLDLTGGAQRFSYDLVQLKQYHKQIRKGALIIIDASPISFSHRPADKNDGMQYMFHSRVAPFLIPDLKVGDYVQSQLVPFVRSGYLLREKYGEKVKARIMEEERWEEPEKETVVKPTPDPSLATRKLNVAPEDYFYNIEAVEMALNNPPKVKEQPFIDNMSQLFIKWYDTDEFGVEHFENNRRDLEELIEYCLNREWRPVVITTPVTKILIDGLVGDYLDVYLYQNLDKTNLQGVDYFDYVQDEKLTENLYLFSNADHMSAGGAAVLSYILMKDLIEAGYLLEAVDGYDYGPLYTYLK